MPRSQPSKASHPLQQRLDECPFLQLPTGNNPAVLQHRALEADKILGPRECHTLAP